MRMLPLAGSLGPLGVPSAPAAFSVLDLPLVLWLKGDGDVFDGSGVPAVNGSAVKFWFDESPAGVVAEQLTAGFRPTFQTNQINGKPCVRFVRTSDHRLDFGPILITNGACFIVFKKASLGALGYLVGGSGSQVIQQFSDGTYYWVSDANDPASVVFTDSAGWQIGFWQRSGTTVTARKNGSQGTNTITVQETNLSLVGRRTSAGVTFDGDIAEIILCDSALSAQQITDTEAYLNSRYAIF